MDTNRPLNSFEERRNARIDRLLAAAERKEKESSALLDQAHTMGDVIPFGQPILVGHHSEKRDRNYRARIESKYRKGFSLSAEAKDLARRAEAAQHNTAIFSDDPDAAEKLEEKIARLEKRQAMMKAVNKIVRKNDRAGLAELGFSELAIQRLFTPDFCGRVGFPDYAITNNGANIRRLKERLQHIEKHATDETSETETNGVKIVDNVEDNRLQMFFPGKPSDEIRAMLKSRGFRWSPTNGCWQAYRGNAATWNAQEIVKRLG